MTRRAPPHPYVSLVNRMRGPNRFLRRLASLRVFGAGLLLAGAAVAHNVSAGEAAPPRWSASEQMIVVVTPDWSADHGVLRMFERIDGAWRATGESSEVTVGRAGVGWGLGLHPPQADGPEKAEGDGRAPAGVFAIGDAFGYAEQDLPHIAYRPMQATHYCIDVADSPLYNRIVDTREVGDAAVEGSTEPMRRDIHVDGDQRYKLGFVIEHNPANVAAGGSCIFAHLWSAPDVPTAGCTAMTEAAMRGLLDWLDPKRSPVFVLLPQAEYTRLQHAWHLPALAGDAP